MFYDYCSNERNICQKNNERERWEQCVQVDAFAICSVPTKGGKNPSTSPKVKIHSQECATHCCQTYSNARYYQHASSCFSSETRTEQQKENMSEKYNSYRYLYPLDKITKKDTMWHHYILEKRDIPSVGIIFDSSLKCIGQSLRKRAG